MPNLTLAEHLNRCVVQLLEDIEAERVTDDYEISDRCEEHLREYFNVGTLIELNAQQVSDIQKWLDSWTIKGEDVTEVQNTYVNLLENADLI